MPFLVRTAKRAEIPRLARIWHDGWHDAHASLVPAALTRFRTPESFAERLGTALETVRVAASAEEPVGFCMVKGDELYQLFVSVSARGSGAAAALLADGETRLAAGGVETAWLACAIGNERAARFYEKHGWRRARVMVNHAEIPGGTFPLEVWRYEKRLR
jgi:ribosomal protein S18 acetylase RimI-like enzyme